NLTRLVRSNQEHCPIPFDPVKRYFKSHDEPIPLSEKCLWVYRPRFPVTLQGERTVGLSHQYLTAHVDQQPDSLPVWESVDVVSSGTYYSDLRPHHTYEIT